ncbi:hypothetical protein KY285_008037 [Solanum tuberosum]|nr:hypothetical protein KY285_008037 [Solanum tuberosum]
MAVFLLLAAGFELLAAGALSLFTGLGFHPKSADLVVLRRLQNNNRKEKNRKGTRGWGLPEQ